MTNLLEFPTGLLTIILILVALYVLCSIIAWAFGDDEPIDEIRQGRMSEFAKEQWLKGLHLEGLHRRAADENQQGRERDATKTPRSN